MLVWEIMVVVLAVELVKAIVPVFAVSSVNAFVSSCGCKCPGKLQLLF